jgi:hypothetical protein
MLLAVLAGLRAPHPRPGATLPPAPLGQGFALDPDFMFAAPQSLCRMPLARLEQRSVLSSMKRSKATITISIALRHLAKCLK